MSEEVHRLRRMFTLGAPNHAHSARMGKCPEKGRSDRIALRLDPFPARAPMLSDIRADQLRGHEYGAFGFRDHRRWIGYGTGQDMRSPAGGAHDMRAASAIMRGNPSWHLLVSPFPFLACVNIPRHRLIGQGGMHTFRAQLGVELGQGGRMRLILAPTERAPPLF